VVVEKVVVKGGGGGEGGSGGGSSSSKFSHSFTVRFSWVTGCTVWSFRKIGMFKKNNKNNGSSFPSVL